MSFTATPIKDLWLFTPRIFKDDRGEFYETYNRELFHKNGLSYDFVQDNQSFSVRNVIRGLHFQTGAYAQSKLVRAVQGTIVDVAVDIRRDSATFLQSFSVVLSAENHTEFLIPKGFAHGFSVLSETAIVAYKCDNFYHPKAESGIRFDDPTLNIEWQIPLSKALLSEKDRQFPFVKTLFPAP